MNTLEVFIKHKMTIISDIKRIDLKLNQIPSWIWFSRIKTKFISWTTYWIWYWWFKVIKKYALTMHFVRNWYLFFILKYSNMQEIKPLITCEMSDHVCCKRSDNDLLGLDSSFLANSKLTLSVLTITNFIHSLSPLINCIIQQ